MDGVSVEAASMRRLYVIDHQPCATAPRPPASNVNAARAATSASVPSTLGRPVPGVKAEQAPAPWSSATSWVTRAPAPGCPASSAVASPSTASARGPALPHGPVAVVRRGRLVLEFAFGDLGVASSSPDEVLGPRPEGRPRVIASAAGAAASSSSPGELALGLEVRRARRRRQPRQGRDGIRAGCPACRGRSTSARRGRRNRVDDTIAIASPGMHMVSIDRDIDSAFRPRADPPREHAHCRSRLARMRAGAGQRPTWAGAASSASCARPTVTFVHASKSVIAPFSIRSPEFTSAPFGVDHRPCCRRLEHGVELSSSGEDRRRCKLTTFFTALGISMRMKSSLAVTFHLNSGADHASPRRRARSPATLGGLASTAFGISWRPPRRRHHQRDRAQPCPGSCADEHRRASARHRLRARYSTCCAVVVVGADRRPASPSRRAACGPARHGVSGRVPGFGGLAFGLIASGLRLLGDRRYGLRLSSAARMPCGRQCFAVLAPARAVIAARRLHPDIALHATSGAARSCRRGGRRCRRHYLRRAASSAACSPR